MCLILFLLLTVGREVVQGKRKEEDEGAIPLLPLLPLLPA
jgi:hypothetical protein